MSGISRYLPALYIRLDGVVGRVGQADVGIGAVHERAGMVVAFPQGHRAVFHLDDGELALAVDPGRRRAANRHLGEVRRIGQVRSHAARGRSAVSPPTVATTRPNCAGGFPPTVNLVPRRSSSLSLPFRGGGGVGVPRRLAASEPMGNIGGSVPASDHSTFTSPMSRPLSSKARVLKVDALSRRQRHVGGYHLQMRRLGAGRRTFSAGFWAALSRRAFRSFLPMQNSSFVVMK